MSTPGNPPPSGGGGHQYLSTSCLHATEPGREELHAYCQGTTGSNGETQWVKAPASCKFCGAPCVCTCHTSQVSYDLPAEAREAAGAAIGSGPRNVSEESLEAVDAALEAAAATIRAGDHRHAGRAAETGHQHWLAILTDHYLLGTTHDLADHTIQATCGCRQNLGWLPSIGEARRSWIDHVSDVAGGSQS